MDLASAKERERGTGRLKDRKMKLNWRASWCLHKNSNLVLKLAALLLLVGFGFRILSHSSTDSLDSITADSVERVETPLLIDGRDGPEPPVTADVSPPAEGKSRAPSQYQVTGEGNPNVAAFLFIFLLESA